MRPESISHPRKQKSELLTQWMICALLGLSVCALFYPVFNYDFVNYDDSGYIGDNLNVQKGLTREGFIWAFTTGHMSNWHPLTWLSHMLDVEMFGPGPGAQHRTNVLFHALNSLLVFLVLKKITGALWRSAFVAALFAVHPLHVESVAWISERKDVLSTFFWMLTIWAYAKYVQGSKSKIQSPPDATRNFKHSLFFYVLALLFFALGLMSKPMVVTLPFVLLLLDFWPLRRVALNYKKMSCDQADRQVRPTDLLLEKIPFFALTIAASVATFIMQKKGGAVSSLVNLPITSRTENAIISYIRYLGKTLWPKDLSVFYPHPDSWPLWQVIASAALLLTISSLAIWLAQKDFGPFEKTSTRSYFLVSWFWFLGTLVPVIGLVQVGMQSMADRYTYIPSIGIFIAIAWGAHDLFSCWRFPKIAPGLCAGIILVSCATLTRIQISYWKNSELLFRHAIQVTKNNFIAYNHLGYVYLQQERCHEAIEAYRKSLEIEPRFDDAHNNLGYALAKLGKHNEAIVHYGMALKINPELAEAHNNLGNSLVQIGQVDEATAHYEIELNRNPKNAKAHNNLGIVRGWRGNFQSAVEHFRTSCKLEPDYLAPTARLAWILSTHPNPEFRNGSEAVRLASHAAKLTEGKDAGVFETLAAAYAELGNFAKAITTAKKAMQLAGDSGETQTAAQLASEIELYEIQRPLRDTSMED